MDCLKILNVYLTNIHYFWTFDLSKVQNKRFSYLLRQELHMKTILKSL